MNINIDISLQISQLHKRGNSKKYKGCAMGLVSDDKKIKNSVYLSKKEVEKIIKYYQDKFTLKETYIKIHSIMVYLCLEKYLPYLN
mgnify:FL=1